MAEVQPPCDQDRRRIIESIAASFGDEIATESDVLLRQPENQGLSLLALLAKAEEQHFRRSVGHVEQLSLERLDSRISLTESDDQPESWDVKQLSEMAQREPDERSSQP